MPQFASVQTARAPQNTVASRQTGENLIYAGLLAVAVVRLWILPLWNGFWLDETGTFWAASGSLREVFSRSLLWPSQFPLYSAIAWAALHLPGPPEVTMRLPSVAAMGAGALLLYRLGIRLVNRPAAWFATLIFVCLQPVAFAAADARSYAIGLLAVTGAMLMLVRWIDSGRLAYGIGYAGFAALTWHMHYVFATTFIVHGIYVLYRMRGGSRFGILHGLFVAAAAVLLAAPSAPHLLAMVRTAASHGFAGTPSLSDLFTTLAPPALVCGILLAAALAYFSAEDFHLRLPAIGRDRWLLLLLWAIVPCAIPFAVSSVSAAKIFLPRYVLPCAPALALLAGTWMAGILPVRRRPAMAVIVVASLVFSAQGLLDFSHGGDWRKAMRTARSLADGAPVLIRSGFPESEPFNWLGSRTRMEYLFAPLAVYPGPANMIPLPFRRDAAATRRIEQIASATLESKDRFLVVEMGDSSYDLWLAGRLSPAGFTSRSMAGFGGPYDSLRVVVFTKQSRQPSGTLIMQATAVSRIETQLAARSADRYYAFASAVLFGTLFILALLTFRQYGITWDEPGQNRYGSLVNRYYLDLLHGRYNLKPILADDNFAYYGGLFESAATAFEHISPLGEFETRHLLNVMVGLISILGCWKLARLLGGYSVAFWAALLLALTPRYYGHMFNNSKDLPFAAGYIWTGYYLLAAIPWLPRIPWKLCLKLGCVVGLTLGIRVGALLLLAYVVLIQAGYLVRIAARGRSLSGIRRDIVDTAWRFAAIAIPGWCIMLAFWPWAQAAPLTRPFHALAYFGAMPWHGAVLFGGRQVEASALPRTYALQWLGITLPEGVLLLLTLAVFLGLRALWLKRKSLFGDAALAQYAFLAFTVMFPLAYVLVTKPVLYDAERHSLYLIPPLICLCAAAWVWALDRLFVFRRSAGVALLGAFIAYLGWQVSIMARLHPQEYVYFNQTVGGLKGASGNYETDYWGNSYHEAVALLVNYVRPERQKDGARKYKVYMTSTQRVSATYYFPSYFSLTYNLADADFFMSTTRYNVQDTVDGCVIETVARFGVPLAVVKDRRCLKAPSPNLQAGKSHDPL